MRVDHASLDNIKAKIGELQSLFKYGERVLPFLEDLLSFVSEITPLLSEMEDSLKESTSKIPNASGKLESVTNQTEMATQEILDTVDNIIMKAMDIGTYFSKIEENNQQKLNLLHRSKREFENILNGKVNKGKVEKLIKSINRHQLNRANRLSGKIHILTEDIQSMSMNIMMALQVQDITTQQLNAVNHLIASIQGKIIDLLKNFSDASFDDTQVKLRDQAYDSDAVFENKENQQHMADELVKQSTKSTAHQSQEEIDRLMDSGLKN